MWEEENESSKKESEAISCDCIRIEGDTEKLWNKE